MIELSLEDNILDYVYDNCRTSRFQEAYMVIDVLARKGKYVKPLLAIYETYHLERELKLNKWNTSKKK